MGTEAAQEEKNKAALHQQGKVGGNAGGGRHQDDRIPWEREHREVCADRDEHGESWSSQRQSHQVPGDTAVRHKDRWACQDLSLVGPQQTSHWTGCSHPHVGFSAPCSIRHGRMGQCRQARGQNLDAGGSSLACSGFTFTMSSRAVAFSFPPWGWITWPPREIPQGQRCSREGRWWVLPRVVPLRLFPGRHAGSLGTGTQLKLKPPRSLRKGHPPPSTW